MFSIHEVKSWDSISGQLPLWQTLHQTMAPENPFVSASWSRIWFESAKQQRRRTYLLASREKDAEGLILITKGFTRKYGIPVISLESAGVGRSVRERQHLFCELELLLKRDAVDPFLTCLADFDQWTFFRLAPVPADYPLIKDLIRAAARYGITVLQRTYSLGYKINGLISWEEYERSRSKKFLKNIKKLYRKALDGDELEIHKYRNSHEINYLISIIEKISTKSWKIEVGSDIFNSTFHDFFKKIFSHTFSTGKSTLYVLTYHGKPIGYEWHLREGNRNLALKADYDQNFAHFSPGNILAWHALKESFAEGASEIDYLIGGGDYKKRWATDVYQMDELLLFNSSLYSKLIHKILLRAGEIDSFRESCRQVKQKSIDSLLKIIPKKLLFNKKDSARV